ncbi:WD40-repeat-containing domain protein [Chytridium lagenaria]|nr:WD40-repeat-containing domain protein [Chytridium lagenaria]
MSSPEVHQFLYGTPVTCHSFNKDRTEVALCPANNEVHIYRKSPTGWNLVQVLREHDKLVTSIDWAPETNKIVTCGQDRNAYVWTLEKSQWRPKLVLLRINRAATFVRWSPKENKFAVATGSRLIAVAYFDPEYDWYSAKHIRKHFRSTVLTLDWHPNNILLAAGASDKKTRVVSAFIKSLDAKVADPIWGDKLPFDTLCAELGGENAGWVHSVAFSPSGNTLAWASHDGTITVSGGPGGPIKVITSPNLPILSLFFSSETEIVGAGHDCVPFLYSQKGGKLLTEKLDKGKSLKSEASNSAMNKFKMMDSRSQAVSNDVELPSTHQNTITSVRPHVSRGGRVEKFSSSSVDGKIVVWSL